MSDYHPESWNPSWSVETLLVGLQSFMYEDSDAIGSIRASAAERERLAAASQAYNAKNSIFRELFSGAAGGAPAAAAEPDAAASASVCRFCFSSEGELVSPCTFNSASACILCRQCLLASPPQRTARHGVRRGSARRTTAFLHHLAALPRAAFRHVQGLE